MKSIFCAAVLASTVMATPLNVDHLVRRDGPAEIGIGQNSTGVHLGKRYTCGYGTVGDKVCPNSQCCSKYGWCGATADYCGSNSASGTDVAPTTAYSPMCGGGSTGKAGDLLNGYCSAGNCCSKYGWCGSSSDHCGANSYSGNQVYPVSLPSPSGCNANSNLQTCTVQTAVDKFFSLVNTGGSPPTSTTISSFTSKFNSLTSGWSALNKAQLLAHIIWESQALIAPEELGCVRDGVTCDNYQSCSTGWWDPAPNGQKFYGRGYLQLSWCYNYKAFGSYLGKDLYNYPNKVLTDYPLESATWFYRVNVGTAIANCGGAFGCTTRVVNSGECNSGNNWSGSIPNIRWQIFQSIAPKFGISSSSYSEGGCYN